MGREEMGVTKKGLREKGMIVCEYESTNSNLSYF